MQQNSSAKINNKDKILLAARQLIQTKGVAATSLSDIAESAGIAKGTLHYYYHSKANLLFDLAESISTQFSSRFLEVAQKNSEQTVREEAMKRLITDLTSHENNMVMIQLIMEGATGNEELKTKFRHLYSLWQSTIKQGLELLLGSSVSTDEAEIVLSSLIGLLFDTAVKEQSINPELFQSFIFKSLKR